MEAQDNPTSNAASRPLSRKMLMDQVAPGKGGIRTEISDALGKSAELLLLSRFDAALSVLAPFDKGDHLLASDAVAIARGKARVFISRGYPRLAHDVLLEAEQAFLQHLDEDSALGLSVHLAFVTLVGCGKPLEDESLLLVAQDVLDERDIEVYNQSTVEMQSHLDRIAIIKQTLNRLEHENVLPRIGKRLDRLMKRSQDLRHFQEIWILLAPYRAAKPDEEVIHWLEELLSYSEMPRSLYAHFSLELAQKLLAKSPQSDFRTWLTNADIAFTESGNVFGSTEVHRIRLQHGLEEAPNPLHDLVGITVEYIEADYPLGVLQSAISPLTLAFNRGNYGLYINLQECFYNICKAAEIKLEGLLLEIQLLAALNAGTGHYATVSKLGRSLYEECIDLKYWTMAYLAGRVLSLAQNMRGNNEEALELAEDLENMCQREGLQVRSEAAYHLAMIRGSRSRQSIRDRVVDCNEIIKDLLPTVDADVESEENKMACEKLCFIAGLQFEIARLRVGDYPRLKGEACATIDRIRALACQLDGNDRVTVEGTCDEMICTQLLFEGNKVADNTKELEGIQVCTKLIEAYDRQNLKFHAAMKYQFRASFHQQLYKKQSDLEERIEQLAAAEKDLSSATDLLREIMSWQQALVARHALVRVHVEAWDLVKIPVDFVMESLRELEALADHQRRELSVFGGLTALLQKQKLSATEHLRDLYNWAIAVSARSGQQQNLFLWSQKRKARGLSEMLGLGILIPTSVKEALNKDASTKHLFEELQSLRLSFNSVSTNEQTYIMQRIEDCERTARQNSIFDNFIMLRDGIVTRLEDLGILKAADDAAMQKRGLMFADWISSADSLYLVTVDVRSPEASCRMHQLPITLSRVRSWTNEHFKTQKARKDCLDADSLSSDTKPLRILDSLISPLQNVSEPGDLLLLSPTDCLAALPLHVLRINASRRMPLIERNPVVYVPSLPIAKMCVSRGEQGDVQKRSLFFGVFDKGREAQLIYEQMDGLATAMGGQSICDQVATKERYMAEVSSARLIHHHLHCVFSADNVLKQSIILSPSAKDAQAQPNAEVDIIPVGAASGDHDTASEAISALKQASHDADSELLLARDDSSGANINVEEIFSLALNSPLVVLVACESASQTISEGDEPLGLISGFLCAGAASVIGASWPIPSRAGRKFSEVFYREITSSTSSGQAGPVDLALALQEAVLTIRDEWSTSSTYHWGAFCLYGAWIFQPPWSRSESIETDKGTNQNV